MKRRTGRFLQSAARPGRLLVRSRTGAEGRRQPEDLYSGGRLHREYPRHRARRKRRDDPGHRPDRTIGYLVTESETIWITSADGQAVPGHALAYDQETGFGLVQALGSSTAAAGHGRFGPVESRRPGGVRCWRRGHHAIETRLVGRQEFAGYWEYVLDDALFIAPAHPFWGGGGLIGTDGKLMGIGSLILQQGDGKWHGGST